MKHNNRFYAEFSLRYPEEYEYFKEWARKFPDSDPDRRYGILIMNAPPDEVNMIYSHDPKTLRSLHIDALTDNPDLLKDTIGDFRSFLDWLEGVEGKGPAVPRHSPQNRHR